MQPLAIIPSIKLMPFIKCIALVHLLLLALLLLLIFSLYDMYIDIYNGNAIVDIKCINKVNIMADGGDAPANDIVGMF